MVLLSIIIPTKNRYSCLFPVIKAFTKYISRNDVEFIIQDNSDNNQLAVDFFRNFHDKRCRYFYISDSISIADNTICAINHMLGKYATFIGDDDLVSPYIVDIVDRMERQEMEALIFNCGYYWWDSVEFKKENYYKRKKALWIPSAVSLDFLEKKSADELTYLLANGGTGIFNLPRFYHGIVIREVLEKIKQQVGAYLVGSCPDIAFATSIALVVDKYYYLNYPVTIYGASKNSGGGWSAKNKHYGKIEDQKFLKENILDVWDDKIPRVWSAQTIYAETVSEVLREFERQEKLNYNAFYASMIVYEPFLIHYLRPVFFEYYKKNKSELWNWLKILMKKFAGKVYRNFRFKLKKHAFKVFIISDVDACMKKLMEYKC